MTLDVQAGLPLASSAFHRCVVSRLQPDVASPPKERTPRTVRIYMRTLAN